jgi:hypothetical protein
MSAASGKQRFYRPSVESSFVARVELFDQEANTTSTFAAEQKAKSEAKNNEFK